MAGFVPVLATLTLHPYEAVEPHMGTLFRIKLYAANELNAQNAFRAAFARIAELDTALSDYKPDSELNRLTHSAVHQWTPVSNDLSRVVEKAQLLAAETAGGFDITLGPLTHLWRESRKANRVPTSLAIQQAKARCGYTKLHLDRAKHSIRLDVEGMQLDVGAIAKGDAADQALQVIGKCGIHSALVAASGDLAFSDAPPGETGWRIGLDSLDVAQEHFTRILLLANRAVSTSGPGEQHLDAGGIRYSHIVDPSTGLGLTRAITVSVIADRGIDADSLSTAVSVLGVERGFTLIQGHPDTAALILTRQGERDKVLESASFRLLRALQ